MFISRLPPSRCCCPACGCYKPIRNHFLMTHVCPRPLSCPRPALLSQPYDNYNAPVNPAPNFPSFSVFSPFVSRPQMVCIAYLMSCSFCSSSPLTFLQFFFAFGCILFFPETEFWPKRCVTQFSKRQLLSWTSWPCWLRQPRGDFQQ